MTAKKLSVYLFTIGAVFATTLILLFRFYQIRYFILFFEVYNPVPILDIAYLITSVVFDRIDNHSIHVEAVFFDITAIVVFGLECVLIGFLFFKIAVYIKRKYCIKRNG